MLADPCAAGLPDWEKLEEGTGGSLKERLARGELLDEALAAGIPDDLLRVERPEFRVPGGAPGNAATIPASIRRSVI